MSKRILWIDNDRILLRAHVHRLEAEGYVVNQVFTLKEGLSELEKGKYNLLILDAMMPVREEEKLLFHPKDTSSGRKAGLVFYNKYKEMLEKEGITVFVFTIRGDAYIREEFLDRAGLPPQNFMTKSEGANAVIFLARVKELLGKESAQ